MNKEGFVYIMTNKNKTTLYIGVTNDLCRRIYEHKNHLLKNSFTDKYNLEHCIYYEEFAHFDLAIQREKELKKWNRKKKEDLINKKNPEWKDMATEHGIVREKITFSQQVNDLINELEQSGMISPIYPEKNKYNSGHSDETW
jgi:putative endonuclease